jgi:hypothetical protein
MRGNERLVEGERFELVRRLTNGSPVSFDEALGNGLRELGVRIEPRAHRGAAERELGEMRQRRIDGASDWSSCET